MQQSSTTQETIRVNNLDANRIIARESIRYPIELIIPTGPITSISLSNENSGNIIDANTLSTQYMIMTEADLMIGNKWEVYINSELPIIFGNNSGKTLISSGVVYVQDGPIGSYEFVPPTPVPDGSEIPQPGNKARYMVTVTDITDTTVRIAVHVIFINSV